METEGILSVETVTAGLDVLGKHPLAQNHCYLELNVSDKGIANIDLLQQYPMLMYLDISNNKITSLETLAHIKALVQLNASKNELTKCLDFDTPRCSFDRAWPSGKDSIGSMLTLANLSFNKITQIDDLSKHPFLECLILKNNMIGKIEGLNSLKYLKVLDLSNNKLTAIEGLNGLPIQELDLSGNQISRLYGLDDLPNLSVLNISSNNISSLGPLSGCQSLYNINASNNQIAVIRQTEFLGDLKWLRALYLRGNPCSKKPHYRLRVVYRLNNIESLDGTCVSSNEVILAKNLYQSEGGDLSSRSQVHYNVFQEVYSRSRAQDNMIIPDFENFGAVLLQDEEFDLTAQELYDGSNVQY